METNQMNNTAIKMQVTDIVGKALKDNKLTNSSTSSIGFGFGYLFTNENNQVEAIIRVIIVPKKKLFRKIEIKIVYIMYKEDEVRLLDITEEEYKNIIIQYQELHPCLKETQ